ncbi:hypothetical protein PVL29_027134 [Vitis rotundifolia]|uniref:Myb/SANT-like domain-containing protein n=1 Tax=Vitis rotundifolia TaxID=103349 RepID=A0AA38YIC3_VITRO|nr:hypothetical protein PVL29_027134 [Vitis rotundifolia]
MESTSSGPIRGRGKNKRVWTPKEDAKLIESLVELCVSGKMKCDNGFRPGTFAQVERLLEDKLPGCGLKASPHIESRVKTLKRQYNAITDMLSHGRGFSWDEKNKMIHCHIDVYERWVKDHRDAHGLRLKPFPHYEDLKQILGKDRVCKKEIVSPAGVMEELHQEEVANNDVGLDIVEADVSVAQPSASASSSKEGSAQSCRKRSREYADLAEVMVRTCNALERLISCIARQQEKEQRVDKVVGELMKLPGLSKLDILKLSEVIISDPVKVTLFFSLDEDLKKEWMGQLLRTT